MSTSSHREKSRYAKASAISPATLFVRLEVYIYVYIYIYIFEDAASKNTAICFVCSYPRVT